MKTTKQTQTMIPRLPGSAAPLLTALALAGCGGSPNPPAAGGGGAAKPSAALEAVFTSAPASGEVALHTVVEAPQEGEKVVVKGKVMGAESVFVGGRAAFMVADPSLLTSCDLRPGDSCTTPWDVCCDAVETRRKAIATVQVVGPDGRVLREPIRGVRDLVELSEVTVEGTVAKGSAPGALVIDATGIYVHAGK